MDEAATDRQRGALYVQAAAEANLSNVIPGHFPQAPAIRCIIKDQSAELVDFVAIKVARQVCAEDEIELVARIIHRHVAECREILEKQDRAFNLFGRTERPNG